MWESPSYVRYAERIFPARLTEVSTNNELGEYRYGWIQQEFSPFVGSYQDAEPALLGSPALNYATELRGRLVDVGTGALVWMRLKGSVGQYQVYEFCGAGDTTDLIVQNLIFQDSSTQSLTTTAYTNLTLTATTPIIHLDTTTAAGTVTIQGIVPLTATGGGDDTGGLITLINDGPYAVVFVHDSATTTAGNEIVMPGGGTGSTLTLGVGDTLVLHYDTDTSTHSFISTTGKISRPAQTASVSTQQNDFATTSNIDTIRLTVSTAVDFTGLTGGTPGRTVRLESSDASTATLTLTHGDTDSSALNRFDIPGNVSFPLTPGTAVDLVYDGSLWVPQIPAPRRPYSPSVSGSLSDYAIPIGSASFVPTLTAAASMTGVTGIPVGMPFLIVNPGANSYDLTLTNGGDFTFSSAADVVLSPGETLWVVNDGSNIVDLGGSLSLAGTGGTRTEGTLAAAGSSQSDAAAIVDSSTIVSGASGTNGVILPSDVEAGIFVVRNDDAINGLLVYPQSGAAIGTLGTNNADTISITSSHIYYRLSSTLWAKQTIL